MPHHLKSMTISNIAIFGRLQKGSKDFQRFGESSYIDVRLHDLVDIYVREIVN